MLILSQDTHVRQISLLRFSVSRSLSLSSLTLSLFRTLSFSLSLSLCVCQDGLLVCRFVRLSLSLLPSRMAADRQVPRGRTATRRQVGAVASARGGRGVCCAVGGGCKTPQK